MSEIKVNIANFQWFCIYEFRSSRFQCTLLCYYIEFLANLIFYDNLNHLNAALWKSKGNAECIRWAFLTDNWVLSRMEYC